MRHRAEATSRLWAQLVGGATFHPGVAEGRELPPWEERKERVVWGVMGVDNMKHAFGEVHSGPELG